tara:strand:- start:193 stop:396 length:204 start_codon:yes stop_codon:yes gene_type:complete
MLSRISVLTAYIMSLTLQKIYRTSTLANKLATTFGANHFDFIAFLRVNLSRSVQKLAWLIYFTSGTI